MRYHLILGNKAYSSWSLRGWLLFRAFDIEFEDQVIPLFTDEFERIKDDIYPSQTVPALQVIEDSGTTVIWDSFSIAEFLHEQHPRAGIWPVDTLARAAARSLSADMHSGFTALRSTMPMNLRRRYKKFTPDAETQADIDRVEDLWHWAISRWGGQGPYLFGEKFTAVDAFFAPVATRFHSYSIALKSASRNYMKAVLNHPAVVEFYEVAQTEPWTIDQNEFNGLE